MVGVLPSLRRHLLDGSRMLRLAPACAVEVLELRQRHRRQHRAGPGAEILGGDVLAADLAQVGVDVRRGRRRAARRSSSRYWNSSWPGRSWQALDRPWRRADRGTLSFQTLPLLPRNLKRSAEPSTSTWRFAQGGQAEALVVRARIRRCRRGSGWFPAGGRPSPAPSRGAGRAAPGARRPCRGSPAGCRRRPHVVVLRALAHLAPARRDSGTACGPCASRPVAWMWPFGFGQIQTSVQAGGIASALMRFKVGSSVTLVPSLLVPEPVALAPAADARLLVADIGQARVLGSVLAHRRMASAAERSSMARNGVPVVRIHNDPDALLVPIEIGRCQGGKGRGRRQSEVDPVGGPSIPSCWTARGNWASARSQ